MPWLTSCSHNRTVTQVKREMVNDVCKFVILKLGAATPADHASTCYTVCKKLLMSLNSSFTVLQHHNKINCNYHYTCAILRM